MIFEIENYQTLKRAVEELCDFLFDNDVPVDKVFDSKLAMYELLGNVLKHSGGSAKLQGGLSDGFVELKILSERIFCPPEQGTCSDVYSEHGRGLFLVDSVCTERVFHDDGSIVIKIKIHKE